MIVQLVDSAAGSPLMRRHCGEGAEQQIQGHVVLELLLHYAKPGIVSTAMQSLAVAAHRNSVIAIPEHVNDGMSGGWVSVRFIDDRSGLAFVVARHQD